MKCPDAVSALHVAWRVSFPLLAFDDTPRIISVAWRKTSAQCVCNWGMKYSKYIQ